MQDSITIQQNLTFKEFMSAVLYFSFASKNPLKKVFLIVGFLVLLSTIVAVIGLPEGQNFSSVINEFLPVLLVFAAFLVFIFLICLIIYKIKPYLFKNVFYEFTHWGVTRHGERTEFSKPWRAISRFKETKSFFILYVGGADFHIIQKRMLPDLSELTRFRNLLQENIKGKHG